MSKVLGSILTTTKAGVLQHACDPRPALWMWGKKSGAPGHPPLLSKLKAKQGDLVLKQKKEACDPQKEAGEFYRPAWATELDSISSNKITKKIIIRSEWPTSFWNGIKWVFLCWQNSWAQALPLLQPPKKVGIQAPLSLPEVCMWSTACTAPPADLRLAPRTHVQGLTIAYNLVPLGCLLGTLHSCVHIRTDIHN